MRTISLWRPWPYTFLVGDKRIENRSYAITYRGDVCFQAAQRFDQNAAPVIARALLAGGFPAPSFVPTTHPAGVLAFVGEVVHCVHLAPTVECRQWPAHEHWDDLRAMFPDAWVERQRVWAFGPWCTVVLKIRPFAHVVEWKGSQGWYDVPNRIVADALSSSVLSDALLANKNPVGYRSPDRNAEGLGVI